VRKRPAILGGQPAFEELLPIIRPTLVPFEEMEGDFRQVLASGIITVGPVTRRLETAVASYLGVPEVVGVANCTSGLILVLQAFGLEPGSEVIVPAFTFAATVHGVVWNGLTPVFADARADTCSIDPASVESLITSRTRAIVATDVFGVPAEVAPLVEIAERRGLGLLFDSAQSLGATYQGRPVGGFGAAQVFSLSPTKVVTAVEGGLIATHDEDMAERLRRGRDYGKARDGMDMEFVGLNARMSELHALVAERNFGRLEDLVRARRERLAFYRDHLGDLPGVRFQTVPSDRTTSGNYMVILVEAQGFGLTRDQLHLALARENIQTKKYFYPPVHRQTAFRRWHEGRPSLPVAEGLSREAMALPLWSHLELSAIERIAETIRRLHLNAPEVRAALGQGNPGGRG
jgi:dTDP-4-amino-4,6-dideoxygalactose transaminase